MTALLLKLKASSDDWRSYRSERDLVAMVIADDPRREASEGAESEMVK
jgi:hypothetical protein